MKGVDESIKKFSREYLRVYNSFIKLVLFIRSCSYFDFSFEDLCVLKLMSW
jgi:hypothetical protein